MDLSAARSSSAALSSQAEEGWPGKDVVSVPGSSSPDDVTQEGKRSRGKVSVSGEVGAVRAEELERRRQRRLAKNRVTAATSRERKRAEFKTLEQRVQDLEEDNANLTTALSLRDTEITRVRKELAGLRSNSSGEGQLGASGSRSNEAEGYSHLKPLVLSHGPNSAGSVHPCFAGPREGDPGRRSLSSSAEGDLDEAYAGERSRMHGMRQHDCWHSAAKLEGGASHGRKTGASLEHSQGGPPSQHPFGKAQQEAQHTLWYDTFNCQPESGSMHMDDREHLYQPSNVGAGASMGPTDPSPVQHDRQAAENAVPTAQGDSDAISHMYREWMD